jgi:hypothetical protein
MTSDRTTQERVGADGLSAVAFQDNRQAVELGKLIEFRPLANGSLLFAS